MSPAVLVVGGTGVAGGAAIRAVRIRHGSGADVTALWFGPRQREIAVEGADRSLFGDISDPETARQVIGAAGKRFDWVFYATARGDVGFPIDRSTPEQIAEACRVSFDPLLRLEAFLEIGTLVAYSTFYTLEHQRINYGSMGHAKERIERWVAAGERGRRACIRAGAFPSDSSRAIKLMLRKRAKELAGTGHPVLERYFRGRRPSEAVALLEEGIRREERERYGDTGTTAEDLVQAHLALLDNRRAAFVNVCGRRIWISEEPQLL